MELSLNEKLNIISLKYSPGLLKEMIALSNAAQLDGYEVNLLLNRKYDWLIEEAEFNQEKFLYSNFWTDKLFKKNIN